MQPVDYNISAMYVQFNEVFFDYRFCCKTAITFSATFQIEELALAGDIEASSVHKKTKDIYVTCS